MNGRQLQNACFAWASRILEGRVAGRRIVAPDWLEPQAICWIAMAPDRPNFVSVCGQAYLHVPCQHGSLWAVVFS